MKYIEKSLAYFLLISSIVWFGVILVQLVPHFGLSLFIDNPPVVPLFGIFSGAIAIQGRFSGLLCGAIYFFLRGVSYTSGIFPSVANSNWDTFVASLGNAGSIAINWLSLILSLLFVAIALRNYLHQKNDVDSENALA